MIVCMCCVSFFVVLCFNLVYFYRMIGKVKRMVVMLMVKILKIKILMKKLDSVVMSVSDSIILVYGCDWLVFCFGGVMFCKINMKFCIYLFFYYEIVVEIFYEVLSVLI